MAIEAVDMTKVSEDGQAPPRRKLPVRVEKLNLEGAFHGWYFTARVNPRMELFGMLMGGTYNGMVTALSELTVGEWNFVDEEGDALPQPHRVRANYERWQKEREGNPPISPQELMGKLTIDLVTAMAQAVGKAVQEMPGN